MYKNIGIGTIGPGSFAAAVGFTGGTGPRNIAISDVDGDGKPDLVVSSTYNGVSILRNIGIGPITSGSFAAKVDFLQNYNFSSLTTSDIDGDGKPDLVMAFPYGPSIEILMNACSTGPITSVSFVCARYPHGQVH